VSSWAQPDERAIPVGEVLEFLGLLWSVDHSLQSLSKRLQHTFDVTGPQRLVLRIVGRFPGIPSGEVASILHLHPSTLTGIIARLTRRGLLQKRGDPRDRRRTLLALTARGREIDLDEASAIDGVIAAVLAEAPASAVEGVRTVLGRLAAALESRATTLAAGLGRGAPAARIAGQRAKG
jgi:DNA-binding MarR family transcriptional regulator